MNIEEIRAQVMSLPEVSAWPELLRIFEDSVVLPHQVWEWPYRTCKAVGGDESAAAASSAAILCMMLGISLVDDILDQDPRGRHLILGEGAVANIALAFQSATFRLLATAPLDAERRIAVVDAFAEMGLTVAYGQDLDSQNLQGEENYWKMIRTKSSPYFGAAMYAGAVAGGASSEVAAQLKRLGILTGDVIQIHDDISDALSVPANPDWKQMRTNLLFLYAQTADHPGRERFIALRPNVDDPRALNEAQQILIRCGAVSYAMYRLIQLYRESLRLLDSTPLKDPTPLREVVEKYILPLIAILDSQKIPIPPELRPC